MRYSNTFQSILLICIAMIYGNVITFGQVSIRDKVKLVDKDVFNYMPSEDIVTRKNKTPKIVYSDRNGNQSYEDSYYQNKRNTFDIGTPYYVIGEKNGTYRLVNVVPDIIGKPKTFLSFLFNGKRHFKEPGKVEYAGYIPKNNILLYDHAYISPDNNRPIKYRIGATDINGLHDIHRFFNGDTLKLYGDPFLRNKLDGGFISGEIVYLYKVDDSGKAALISDTPTLSDPSRTHLGWVPYSFIAEVGQDAAYRIAPSEMSDSISGVLPALASDTFVFPNINMQGSILFDLDGNYSSDEPDSVRINYPFSVWDQEWNKIINIAGTDITVSDIKLFENQSKNVNIHLLFFDKDSFSLAPYINVFQNLKLKLPQDKQYTYSATRISSNSHNRYIEPTSDFSTWLDTLQRSFSSRTFGQKSSYSGLDGAIKQISHEVPEKFQNNIFIIIGSNQSLSLTQKQQDRLASHSGRLLFVQAARESGIPYQDFLLQSKSIIDNHSTDYIDSISRYIADIKLVKPGIFKNIDSNDANIFIYDASGNSLPVGGIVFPKGKYRLQSASLEIALDSIIGQSIKIDSLLVGSLRNYEQKIGVLRSRPSEIISRIDSRNTSDRAGDLSRIDKNSINDIFFTEIVAPDSVMNAYEHGYLFTEAQLEELLQNYRSLLPKFEDNNIQVSDLKKLRSLFERQRKTINRSFHREVLTKNCLISDIFYYKTGIVLSDSLFNNITVKELRQKYIHIYEFSDNYKVLIEKLERLEELYQRNMLEPVILSNKKYLFIPEQLTL